MHFGAPAPNYCYTYYDHHQYELGLSLYPKTTYKLMSSFHRVSHNKNCGKGSLLQTPYRQVTHHLQIIKQECTCAKFTDLS